MIAKVMDYLDTSVSMVILMDGIEQLMVLTDAMVSVGIDRMKYEVYKDNITAYMMEMCMPYNRYLAMMKHLRKNGWTLKPESLADIFNRLVKL